jgi:hypothetical protein
MDSRAGAGWGPIGSHPTSSDFTIARGVVAGGFGTRADWG